MKNKDLGQAYLYGLLAAFFWGTHSVIVRYLTQDMHGIAIAVFRLYIAAFALFLILKINRAPISANLSDKYLLVTIFGTVTNYIFFHIGLEHTTASNAMLLENTAPFFVLILLFVFARQGIKRLDTLATVIAILGVFFTVKDDVNLGQERLYGDVLEVLAAFTWAIFVIGSSLALMGTVSTFERIGFLFKVFLVSAILLTPLIFFVSFQPTLADLFYLVLLGIFPTAIAYFLWYEAVARVPTITAALLFNFSIIFTFVNAYLFLGEQISLNMIVGAVLIVAGITLSRLGAREPEDPAEAK